MTSIPQNLVSCLMWLFIHWLYLDQRHNRLLVLLQWLRTFLTGNVSALLITNESDFPFPQSPEARWVAEHASHLENGHPVLRSVSKGRLGGVTTRVRTASSRFKSLRNSFSFIFVVLAAMNWHV